MSLAKRAVEPGKKAIIIDILGEFEVKIAGTGVVIASAKPQRKKIEEYYPLLILGKVDEEQKTIEIFRE